ncbi:MAG: MBOAT family protein [Butyrivibrio sp.]|nr:MBOAT family protein [Butyrivibrio sp.]
MLFNSYIFILLFLPVTVTGYYLLNRAGIRAGEWWLLAMSLWFYGYFNPWYLLLIGSSIVVNYFFSRLLNRKEQTGRKQLLAVAVICNVLLIFYFKYYDFFVSNINALFHTDFVLKHILLPLGISFFTLQQISFIIDSYEGKTGDYAFLEYALFVTFFPQLVAGPIVLHDELIPQFRDTSKKKPQAENLSAGIMQFTLGLAKKMLIADLLGSAVNLAYADIYAVSSAELVIALFAYTFQIYFDFSGYSDMAVGLGKMFNLTLPMNFDSPYKSLSVPEFWRRWHMTLNRFFRRYLYIPLGGSRKGRTQMLVNTMIVFTVSGIWHGANFTFILWGMLHGLAVCIGRLTEGAWGKLPRALRLIATFLYVNLLWGLFRADSVTQFLAICRRMILPEDTGFHEAFLSTFRLPYLRKALSVLHVPYTDMGVYMLCAAVLFVFLFLMCVIPENNYKRRYVFTNRSLVWTLTLLVFCIVSLGKVSVFLYFNF